MLYHFVFVRISSALSKPIIGTFPSTVMKIQTIDQLIQILIRWSQTRQIIIHYMHHRSKFFHYMGWYFKAWSKMYKLYSITDCSLCKSLTALDFLKCYKSKFLYSLQLYDISLQFDPADQPIRLFQREKNTDSILLVIERENNLLPVRKFSLSWPYATNYPWFSRFILVNSSGYWSYFVGSGILKRGNQYKSRIYISWTTRCFAWFFGVWGFRPSDMASNTIKNDNDVIIIAVHQFHWTC